MTVKRKIKRKVKRKQKGGNYGHDIIEYSRANPVLGIVASALLMGGLSAGAGVAYKYNEPVVLNYNDYVY